MRPKQTVGQDRELHGSTWIRGHELLLERHAKDATQNPEFLVDAGWF
jgi:hypothetical protein